MIVDIALVLGGLALLVLGGDLLVKGAVNLALRLGITPLVVGLGKACEVALEEMERDGAWVKPRKSEGPFAERRATAMCPKKGSGVNAGVKDLVKDKCVASLSEC